LSACGGGGSTTSSSIPPAQIPQASSSSQPASVSVAAAPAYFAAVSADTPTAYYHLDDSAPTARDASGHGLDGVIGSSVTTLVAGLVSSASDTAMHLPGVKGASGVVSVAQSKLLQPSEAVSLEAFLRFTTVPATYTVAVAYGSDSGSAPYDLYFESGRLVAQFNLSSGVLLVRSPSALQTNTSYHVVSTFDGTTGKLFLNGTLVASASKAGTLTGYSNGHGLTIGDDASYSDPAFNGTIDEVAVYAGKALTSTRVSAHYGAATAAGSAAPSPVATATPTALPASPTPRPVTTPTPVLIPTPAPAPAPAGTVVWKAGDPSLGKWAVSNTYQCGTPVNTGSSFTFNLVQNGTNCGRNQASPNDSSGMSRLTDGQTYTWTFHYIDGKPDGSAPGMGYDVDARSLIWQIHPYAGGNPCVGLDFDNGGVVGQPQQWSIGNCSGNVWRGSYKPGEQDDWKIVILISQTASGHLQLYRNGVKVADAFGATYSNANGGTGNPWWNFGPYKWRWELPGGGGSNMTQVNATIDNMVLTKQ
jgi:Concanavalin A-like lectin/glucanases superfamily